MPLTGNPSTQSFLGIMSLQTGTELISLSMLFNKVTGLYGLLAILTGYALSPLQLSMYLFNLLALILLALCIPHIRKQTPLQNLVLAWLYVVDTAASPVYTAFFAANWYLGTSAAPSPPSPPPPTPPSPPTAARDGEAAGWQGAHDTAASLVLVVAFTLVRFYFGLVVMAHARQVLQRYAEGQSEWTAGSGDDDETDKASAPRGSPFAAGSPAGQGWRGRVGRALVYVGRDYWLGHKEDEEWAQSVSSKFRSTPAAAGSSGGS